MAILKIIKDNDPTLRKISREVDRVSPRITRLLDDMVETLHHANGAGLAAVQVGVLRRVVVVETEDGKTYELINPVIINSEGKQENIEGCLSLPDQWGITNRPAQVTVKALNRKGEFYTVTGTELLARAICHELDHLEGKLFTDCAVHMLTDEELEEYRNSRNNAKDAN